MDTSDAMDIGPIPSAAGHNGSSRTGRTRSGGGLYFAYGSNLHVAQMAQRCPESQFKGKAILPNYRWQINQRGVANVVESAGHSVEGLLYQVSRKDVKALDRSEGVSKSFYERCQLKVAFVPHDQLENLKSSEVAQLLANPQQPLPETHGTGPGSRGRSAAAIQRPDTTQPDTQKSPEDSVQQVEALVYISTNYNMDGVIRDEYILRMRNAVADAMKLGVSKAFVNEAIAPSLEGGPSEQEGYAITPALPEATGATRGGDAASKSSIDELQPPASEISAAQSSLVELQRLRRANREPPREHGLKFPREMLDKVTETRSISTGRGGGSMVYLVLVEESKAGSRSVFEVGEATQDLELANELAISRFRYKCLEGRPSGAPELVDQWVKSDGGGRPRGALEWWLDRDLFVQLRATEPDGGKQLRVWVEARGMVVRF